MNSNTESGAMLGEKAVLVGLIHGEQNTAMLNEYLDELAFLVETAGGIPTRRFTQKMNKPHPKTFIGTGKLQELKEYASLNKIEMIVFDDELSPSQLKNIEKALNPTDEKPIKILDRTHLILDIFAQRARTSHARTQVELAQYQYLLPRLTRMWTHLERQKGGIGMRGPGETEIETDRRIIRDKISLLREKLSLIDKQMMTQRKSRGDLIRVALVGYTNVGKSTIMNMISKSDVFAENKLFATLDTTVRKVVFETMPFLLSDTVGFIRKLPTPLIESFKSTLDEVREADLLLHVVDVSHPNFEEHIAVVKETLHELGAGEKTTLMVFNKADAFVIPDSDEDNKPKHSIKDIFRFLEHSQLAATNEHCVFLSALTRENLPFFREKLFQLVRDEYNAQYPYQNFGSLSLE